MTDVHDKATRSFNMSQVKSKNTGPEILIRKYLFSMGFRYRLHVSKLPGKPDIVLTKHKTVVFVNGCFWHLHGCFLSSKPKSRPNWWEDKLTANKIRDLNNMTCLLKSGWKVITIWTCGVLGKSALDIESVLSNIQQFIASGNGLLNIDSRGVFRVGNIIEVYYG